MTTSKKTNRDHAKKKQRARSGKTWHSYLTSVLDTHVLPPYVVADLYRRRWRIEDAFNTVKRLLVMKINRHERAKVLTQ